jgi:hypothetical protein
VSVGQAVYVVRRRGTGREIVRVLDFRVGDAVVLLLHLCRNFPVEVDCPEGGVARPERSHGYLWVSVREKAKLDAGMREDPTITWEFVCYDLFNGVECAFYRDKKLRLVDLAQVAREYFAEKGAVA